MATRLENTIKVSIPDIRQEVKKIPSDECGELYGKKGRCRDQFLQCCQTELVRCVVEALRVGGEVRFSDLRVPKDQATGQFIMEFEVFDRSKRRKNAYNFHGQNTSQWVYAGAVLYQAGRVSTHH